MADKDSFEYSVSTANHLPLYQWPVLLFDVAKSYASSQEPTTVTALTGLRQRKEYSNES